MHPIPVESVPRLQHVTKAFHLLLCRKLSPVHVATPMVSAMSRFAFFHKATATSTTTRRDHPPLPWRFGFSGAGAAGALPAGGPGDLGRRLQGAERAPHPPGGWVGCRDLKMGQVAGGGSRARKREEEARRRIHRFSGFEPFRGTSKLPFPKGRVDQCTWPWRC